MNVRRSHRLTLLLATFLVMAAAIACVEPFSPADPASAGSRELTVRVVVPTADLVTKADVPAVGAEDKMYEIRIWAFDHAETGDEAVGYGSVTIAAGTNSQEVTVSFPNSVNNKLDNEPSVSVDLYTVANPASVGFTLDGIDITEQGVARKVKRSDLLAAVIDDDTGAGFGTACVSEVPATGLPMSQIENDVDITFLKKGTMETHAPVEIKLKRAVAKIRFVFAKAANMIDDASGDLISTEINRIQLLNESTHTLSPSTFLFPQGKVPEGNRNTLPLTWPANYSQTSLVPATSFANTLVDTPLRLRKDYQNNKEIAAYEALLTAEIADKHAIERVLYLRECDPDKDKVTARVWYKIGTSTETYVDIEIPSGALLNRNTWWTVYAYFMSFEMGFEVTVKSTWDVDNKGAISVGGAWEAVHNKD